MTIAAAIIIVATAFFLTTILTYVKVPSSTIQILVFAVIGVALAYCIPVHWILIGHFLITWALAPPAACALGYLLTRVIDRFSGIAAPKMTATTPEKILEEQLQQKEATQTQNNYSTKLAFLPIILVIFGAAASFTMGANDVSNATRVFLMTHLFDVLIAGLIGGLGLALGALTWGKPLLQRVAFDIVKMDLSMASAAQFAQAIVVFLPVILFGYFTSMNQALVGAMAGTGFARGRQTIQRSVVYGILKGWAVGPLSSVALAFVIERVSVWISAI